MKQIKELAYTLLVVLLMLLLLKFVFIHQKFALIFAASIFTLGFFYSVICKHLED